MAVAFPALTLSVEAPAKNFDAAMRLALEILREPAYPESEFDQVKTPAPSGSEERAHRADATRSGSAAAAFVPVRQGRRAIQSHARRAARGDAEAHPGRREEVSRSVLWRIARSLGDSRPVRSGRGVEDRRGTAGLLDHARALSSGSTGTYKAAAATNEKIEAPDKANAQFEAGLRIPMSQDDPDYPAMVLANYMMGGAITARVPDRIRNREGLSYSVSTSFTAPAEGNAALFSATAISNPATRRRSKRHSWMKSRRHSKEALPRRK